jgi:predicted site-specific integrase-resolvase
MTNTRPDVIKDGRYSMTETAYLLQIDRKTLYRWRKIGMIRTKKYRHCDRDYVPGREILKLFGAWN